LNPESLTESVALSEVTLKSFADRVAIPTYERKRVGRGIVHIGAGGFNRSHLAVYLDDLLQAGGELNWGECGVGLLPPDEQLHRALVAQDYLYGLLEQGGSKSKLRIIGSLVEHLYAPDQTELVLERMSSPECAIVSLTVTEGGYFVEDGTRRFLASDSRIQHDLAFPTQPVTFLGYLAEAADLRLKKGIAPFTVLSCDNLQGNGDTARTALLGYAEMRNPQLRQWVEANVAFPNSMVDRITPRTTDENRQSILKDFAIRDGCPVVSEPFRQWVLEDRFVMGRPSWERAGATFTTDVTAFERVKMRLLNGGHSSIAYVAALLSFNYVHEAMGDSQIRAVLEHFLDEATQVLLDLPGLELNLYKKSVVERFANPFIRDSIMRIASEGTAKLAKFIVPTICEIVRMRGQTRLLTLTVAAWLRAMCGKDEVDQTISIEDASAQNLTTFIRSGGRNAKVALASVPGFERLVDPDSEVGDQIQSYLESFCRLGVRATLQNALSQDPVSHA
jgi:mannitol 2-dehydrogenase